MSAAEATNFNLNIPENITFSHLQFDLGIDSLTNMEGAMDGDLDPTKGMYFVKISNGNNQTTHKVIVAKYAANKKTRAQKHLNY